MGEFLEKYKRSLKELRREYPSYDVWSNNYFFTFYGKILEEQILNEFITKTIDPVKYETKYDIQILPNEKYYYHLTPDLLFNDIKSSGLTPKSKTKISYHPERVYLIKKYDKDKFTELAKNLYSTLEYRSDIIEKIKNYYVLRIDVEALIKSGRDKFYRDPNYLLGIWTYENIPPLYVEKIGEISVNPN